MIKSALVMPIPVSSKIRVLFALSGMIRISNSFSESNTDGSVRERYLYWVEQLINEDSESLLSKCI